MPSRPMVDSAAVAYRSDAEIRGSFEKVAALLDDAMRIAHASAGGEGLALVDHSNRTGVERSSSPYYRYDVSLEERRGDADGGRARVQVSFLEPVDSVHREIKVSWVAERQRPRSTGTVPKQSQSRTWRDSDLPSGDALAEAILELLQAARRALGPG